MTETQSDEFWMAHALGLAALGLTTTMPNPRVGCVIVRDGQNVGEGHHVRAGTGHAEVHALAAAGDRARGATVYVTLEPCSHYGRTPPCAEALIAAKVARVVCAIEDPNPKVAGRGLARLAAAGIDVRSGVLSQDAEALNRGFFKRMSTGRPWLTLKLASSLDGATAMASGESQWITSPAARADVQRARAERCAILTGVGTVQADDPSLTVRLEGTERQPDRVVLDTHLNTPADARMLSLPGATWILHGNEAPEARRAALTATGARLVVLPRDAAGHLDLTAVMIWLGQQAYNEVWAEPGATLAAALLQLSLVDELWLYQAPVLLGAATRPLFSAQLDRLAEGLAFSVMDVRSVGPDLRLQLRPNEPGL
ncbi:bifunctional diaminohydroxyphosphoribosylaminopyrimidine deaminase/5-amino-6-(5-phosphoribosylamino)uracil reductase RibD [Saccharospirillum impatiens]|uniref:bifunctional diaminohydroxyphosphoribosylaminopyrimidine deaminase/5-amino-6-(5-phosphoribosylamino)uracil reductase RibD n=1 Tax=Saccharospirillum impatiens TaxID=169438 RepID=UPI00041FABA7|nr:bifunctional diaminohydroxyphosphoribosylaminopyrimidine deaminase/5-amino-6-(5-phosphoribosylamino)uracil reductase RibD [Saccharospirillum impatiens]